jgi:uncharacterized protein YjbI with pentapeptide repeats
MTAEPEMHRPIAQDELVALARSSRNFSGIRFAPVVSFDELDFGECEFDGCVFAVPSVRSADFSRSRFKNCKFEPTRFASCKFNGAQFDGCVLFDAGQKKGCTFAFCQAASIEAVKSNFATSSFERCDLYNLHAVECSFRGAQFRRSTFTKTISRRSALTKASFDKCNLSFADLSGLSLQSCEFLSCKFSEASFIDADLSNATFLACSLDRAEWDRAKLSQADLRGSELSGLNLALVSDYVGLTISDSEQTTLLEQLGVIVHRS